MTKIISLCNVLNNIGLKKESDEIMLLFKKATMHGLQTLGLKNSAAKLFRDSVGEKWAFVIAKYYIESNLLGWPSFEDYVGFLNSDNKIQKLKALNACDALLQKPKDKREDFCKKDSNCKNLKNYLEDNNRPSVEFTWKEREVDDWMAKYMRLDSNVIDPDYFISSIMKDLEESILSDIKYFIKEDFIKNLISGKYMTPQQAKSLSYNEALDGWMNKKPMKMPVIMNFNDGWSWVDAGGDRSNWVSKYLKNCGSVSWGNLRATTESAQKATMLILIDEFMSPHAIVTWNPEYVDYSYPDDKPKRYLGHLEGIAGKILDQKYNDYFLKLVAHLSPDKIKLSNNTMYTSDGERISYDNLKDKLDEDILE